MVLPPGSGRGPRALSPALTQGLCRRWWLSPSASPALCSLSGWAGSEDTSPLLTQGAMLLRVMGEIDVPKHVGFRPNASPHLCMDSLFSHPCLLWALPTVHWVAGGPSASPAQPAHAAPLGSRNHRHAFSCSPTSSSMVLAWQRVKEIHLSFVSSRAWGQRTRRTCTSQSKCQ